MKLININIEGNKHLERVLPFLVSENPDVICLQEVYTSTVPQFEALGYVGAFLPVTKKEINGAYEEFGTILGSKSGVKDVDSFYYHNDDAELSVFDLEHKDNSINSMKMGVIHANVPFKDTEYHIATTHFTWTPHGHTASPQQIASMDDFVTKVKELEPHVISGDFNIPRSHNPLYKELVTLYTDAVPPSYDSSLDANLHRHGKNPDLSILFTDYMVDYVFTQPPYSAKDVRLEFGISDHAAVVATIIKE